MYILIDKTTNVIIGTAARPVSSEDCANRNVYILKINNSEFTPNLLGSKLEKIEE